MTRYPIELFRDQYKAILENRQHIVFLHTTEVSPIIQCGNVLTLCEVEDVDEVERTGYYFHVDVISVCEYAQQLSPDCYIASVKLKTGKRIRLPAYDMRSWEKTTGIKYIKPVLHEIKYDYEKNSC